MKKVILTILSLFCTFSLMACSEKQTNEEIFINALGSALITRLDMQDKEHTTICDTEYDSLKDYENIEFTDEKLDEQRKLYFEGLKQQQEIANSNEIHDAYDKPWYNGQYKRYQAIEYIYENYDDAFGDNREKIKDNYIDDFNTVKWTSEAYDAVQAYYDSNDSDEDININEYDQVTLHFKNTYSKTISVVFYFNFYTNKNCKEKLGDTEGYVNAVQPGQTAAYVIMIPDEVMDNYKKWNWTQCYWDITVA